jgi:hypothetical protein
VRLEKLCTFELSYDADVRVKAPGYELVSAYDSDEGIAYGEGRGRASGRIEGSVVFSNYPRRRSDGNMLPNARGLVTTGDGAAILFELRGRTIFGDDGVGRQNLVGWFESDHDRYRWLNDVVCIAEGLIGDDGMRIDVYQGVNDLAG